MQFRLVTPLSGAPQDAIDAYNKLLEQYEGMSGFGLDDVTIDVSLADKQPSDFYGYWYNPKTKQWVDQRRHEGKSFFNKVMTAVTPGIMAAGAALASGGAGGLAYAPYAGMAGGIANAGIQGGTGLDMAVQGAAGYGLGLAAQYAGGAGVGPGGNVPSGLTSGVSSGGGGGAGINAGLDPFIEAVPGGVSAGLGGVGELAASSGSSVLSSVKSYLSNLSPMQKLQLLRTIGGGVSALLSDGGEVPVISFSGGGNGYTPSLLSRSPSSSSSAGNDALVSALLSALANRKTEEKSPDKHMKWTDWMSYLRSSQQPYFGNGSLLA